MECSGHRTLRVVDIAVFFAVDFILDTIQLAILLPQARKPLDKICSCF